MNNSLTNADAMTVIVSAIQKGQSFVELIKVQTGITLNHIAVAADQLLNKLRATSYELVMAKAATGNTKPPIERSLSKSLVLFLYELEKMGGDCHYNDVRSICKERHKIMTNDYSSLAFGWRLIEKSDTANGYWRITERGRAFLNGKLTLAEKVTIQNKQVIKASSTLVSVHDFIQLDNNSVSDQLIEQRKEGLKTNNI